MKSLSTAAMSLVACILVAASCGRANAASQGGVVHDFRAPHGGIGASGTLIADSHGDLYGTTQTGGAATCYGSGPACGMVFELVPKGSSYVEKTLYSFRGGADGAYPQFGVIADASGALYGTTSKGGTVCDCGTVFKLTPTPSGYTETVIHTFGFGHGGTDPYAGVAIDANGVLYGTTMNGGSLGYGTAFALVPKKKKYVANTIYEFGGPHDGQHPAAPLLVVGSTLYGTTQAGGARYDCSCGEVFSLTPGSSGYQEKILYSFGATLDGVTPLAGVAIDANGVLYGTTEAGGRHMECIGGCGIVYKLTPGSSGYTEDIVWDFAGGLVDGGGPQAGVTLSSDGRIFGTTNLNGTVNGCSCGIAYEITSTASETKEKILMAFDGANGQEPWGGLLDVAGTLYGTTVKGGTKGHGTVFAVTP